ncbi:MAG TPA: prepilin-type N-terminal cleavage/methylation domain-containing protein [Abditibacterium sp.]|jgi:prepilin-type processing-associated H-X9-DG protein/prepilin-type N-terminal cleavage/methylation domain-containing protein
MKRASMKGFTLVEILMVLGIVALLSALMFAAFIRVRENGKSTSCQSNLRQIALAMQQYVQDNDGRYPNIDYYAIKLMPYLQNSQIFQCPSEEKPAGNNPKLAAFNDYGLHAMAINTVFEPIVVGHHEALVVKPATTILAIDLDLAFFAEVDGACGYSKGWPNRHLGGGNYAFLDGHVKWMNPNAAYDAWCSNQKTP